MTAPTAALIGSLGAYVSAKRRLDAISTSGNQIANLFEIQRREQSIRTAMFAGAVFGLVFYAVLLGELIKGPLFPEFTPRDKNLCPHIWLAVMPKDAISFGKLFVWSFIAGFAERLVPDMLGNFADSATRSSQGK